MLPEGQETMVILIDYKSTTMSTNPSISVARKVCPILFPAPEQEADRAQVLNILQQHYVERLGRGVIVNLPFLLNFFYKGLAPFLDPVTRDKVRHTPS